MTSLRTRLLDQLPSSADWPVLPADADPLPVQGRAWNLARATLMAPGDRLHWLAVEDRRGLAALAPLVRSGHWLHEMPLMYEPSDFVWRSPAALHALVTTLIRQGRPLHLARVPDRSPTLAALRTALAGRGLLHVSPAMPTPVLDLDAARSGPMAGWSPRRRADFRRYQRRAALHGEVGFSVLAPTDEGGAHAAFGVALRVEARSWKAAARTAMTSDAALRRYFREFAAAAAAEGVLRVALMHIGQRPVAMQIALQWQRRFWLFKIAHDREFDACSPGQLLMQHTVQYAVDQGLVGYEFMGVMADWTRLWTSQTRAHVEVRAYPFGWHSAVVAMRQVARASLQRLRKPSR